MRCWLKLLAREKIPTGRGGTYEVVSDMREFDLPFLPPAGMEFCCELQDPEQPRAYLPTPLTVKKCFYDMVEGVVVVHVVPTYKGDPEADRRLKFKFEEKGGKYTFPQEILKPEEEKAK
ncbi:MAG: hypothetical protein Q8R36_01670 [bacterium]|nr:hypothetical protein [bacterium]